MRIKRILFTLLVALMMFSLIAVASFAANGPKPLNVTAEINSSALSDDVSAVKPGTDIELTIEIPENPGLSMLQLIVNHSESQMTYKECTNGVVFGEAGDVLNGNGFVQIDFVNESEEGALGSGKVVVVKFELVADFHGELDFSVEGTALPVNTTLEIPSYEIFATSARTYTVHNYGEPTIVDPTCTSNGTVTFTCSGAACTDRIYSYETDMLPHTEAVEPVKDNVVEATCTEPGSHDDVYYCTVCGLQARREVGIVDSALGHEFLEENYKSNGDATCTEDGHETAKCTRCDQTDVRIDVDSKLGHEFLEENFKSDNNATCTADGTETAKCTRCDETKTQTDEGSMLAHTYGEWKVTTDPTTTAQGEETRTCTACPAKETRPVKKLPVIVTAPTEAWAKGDGDKVFKSDADFADFESVTVNGEVLAAENYTVKEGSIVVTLSEKYLKTLENGTYTICIKSANGTAESTFTIENSSGWIVAVVIIAAVVVCAGVVVGVVFYKKKKAAN